MIWPKDPKKEVSKGIKNLFPRLWRYCIVLTGSTDRAEDLAQSVCLRALEKAEQYEPGTQLDRWIFRIAQRMWFNELRADSVRLGGGISTTEEIDICDNSPGPESRISGWQVLSEVLTLPEAQRITVGLVYIEGYSYKEASETLDIPIGTVMSRLSAARSSLSQKLTKRKSSVV